MFAKLNFLICWLLKWNPEIVLMSAMTFVWLSPRPSPISNASNEDKNKRSTNWVNETDCEIKFFYISLTFLCCLFFLFLFFIFYFFFTNKKSSDQPFELIAITFYLVSTLFTVLYIYFFKSLSNFRIKSAICCKQSILMLNIIVTKLHTCSHYEWNKDR